MCRAGGRRCPGCNGQTGRAAHNERRRRNRALKREILELAEEAGAAPEVLRRLEEGPPEVAKKWAAENGLPSHLHPGRGHASTPAQTPAPLAPAPAPAPAAAGLPPVGAGGPGLVGPAASASAPQAPQPSRGWWETAGLRQQIETLQSRVPSHRDERSLLSGRVMSITRVGGGTNTTAKVVLDNGMVGYFKDFEGLEHDLAEDFGQDSAQQPIHEVAAWVTAREMGPPWSEMVPPVVLREVGAQLGSFALERPGIPHRQPKDVDAGDARAAAFYDALVGQQDRHPANYLVSGDRVALIDHGYTFATEGDYANWSHFQASRLRGENAQELLDAREIDALDRFLGSEDSWGLKGLLEDDRLAAMRARATTMRQTGRLLGLDCYGG